MSLDLSRVLRRQWLIVLASVVVTVAACTFTSSHVSPQYRASSQMLLLLPPETPDPDAPPINPYLNLPDGMATTASLVAGMVSTEDVQAELGARGLTAEYTVTAVTSQGPLLDVSVTGASPEVALSTRDALMHLVDDDLARLQAEADTPTDQLMTASRPVVSQETAVIRTPVIRAVVAAGAAGLLLTTLLCLLVDRLRRALAARSVARTPSDAAQLVASARERSRARLLDIERAGQGASPTPTPTPDDTDVTPVEEPAGLSMAGAAPSDGATTSDGATSSDGATTSEEQPQGEQPQGEQPQGEQPQGEQPQGEHTPVVTEKSAPATGASRRTRQTTRRDPSRGPRPSPARLRDDGPQQLAG